MNTSLLALWTSLVADPYLSGAAAVLVLSLGALALLILLPARRTRVKSTRAERPAQARSMAKRGTAPAEIARKTGLSHDAVAMLLSASAKGARKSRPEAAGIAHPAGAADAAAGHMTRA